MSDAPNGSERAGRREILDMLDDRHRDEWELVHGAYGVEELPSELDARHGRERASLEKRLNLLPPKPGEFATLDDFMRASEPALQAEIAAGTAEVRSMVDAAIREDAKLWREDSDWDDPTWRQLRQSHKEFRADIEYRVGEYQPLRGEFASLDAFMSATEHLAAHEEVDYGAREKEEISRAWQQPAFSRETIEADPHTAVRLPIPENASGDLLEYARGWAADLERYAENERSVFARPMGGPFEDRPQQDQIDAARERVEVLGGMIGELALQESASAELKLPPDPEGMNDARAEWAAASIRHFQVHTGTDWEDAPSDLLGDLMHFCDRNGFDFEHELLRARSHYEAETLGDEAELQPDLFAENQPIRQAVSAPGKMTEEAIERDPRNAVTMDLPDDASRELLSTVYFAASRLDRGYFELYEDAETTERAREYADFSRDAAARAEVAFDRLGGDGEPATPVQAEAAGIAGGDGRTEILGMLKTEQAADLKYWAEGWTDESGHDHTRRQEAEHIEVERRLDLYAPRLGEFASVDAFMEATETIAQQAGSAFVAAETLIERTAQVIERGLEVATNAGERLARVADITLGAVIGFFVDEPKMTAAQIHDTLQAAGNVETIHAREVAAAEAIEAGAHETRMLEMKGGQQEHDLRLAMTLGTNATAEANIGLDEHEGARRTQKLSL